jgi:uncharacterized protein (DUF427 family)
MHQEHTMRRPQPINPEPGQESVWDYPRPPRLEPASNRIQIILDGVVIADTQHAQRVLETSHPPVYYIPPEDVRMEYLHPSRQRSFCEWKGAASYYTLTVGERTVPDAAWYYPDPTPGFAAIKDHLAFYPSKMDECLVDGERVQSQPGDFYGGWITNNIVGPFKGDPGTWGW